MWLKDGFGLLLAVSQPSSCRQASSLPGTKVLDGLVEPQVPEMQSRSRQVLHLTPSTVEPGVRSASPVFMSSLRGLHHLGRAGGAGSRPKPNCWVAAEPSSGLCPAGPQVKLRAQGDTKGPSRCHPAALQHQRALL